MFYLLQGNSVKQTVLNGGADMAWRLVSALSFGFFFSLKKADVPWDVQGAAGSPEWCPALKEPF